jgi:hypothetical protein
VISDRLPFARLEHLAVLSLAMNVRDWRAGIDENESF